VGYPTVKEDVGDQWPQEKLLPNQNGDESQINVDLAAHQHLEEKNSQHDREQFLNDRGQIISERKTVTVIGHFIFPSEYLGSDRISVLLYQRSDLDSNTEKTESKIPQACRMDRCPRSKAEGKA